jgi:hypothetical protein
MSDLERATAFEELIRDRCVERVVETRFGPALFNDTYSTIWFLNVLRAERPGDATAEEIAAESDRVQAGLGHRRVILPPGATVSRTASASSAGSPTTSSSWFTGAAVSRPTRRT